MRDLSIENAILSAPIKPISVQTTAGIGWRARNGAKGLRHARGVHVLKAVSRARQDEGFCLREPCLQQRMAFNEKQV